MIQAAASELREQGVHVPLLIVDATIENDRTRERLVDKDPIQSTGEQDVAKAVAYLAGQSERGRGRTNSSDRRAAIAGCRRRDPSEARGWLSIFRGGTPWRAEKTIGAGR
jgi:hypothetical protein